MVDRLYENIRRGLGRLEGERHQTFERCVVDLLSNVGRSVVHVKGGADAGMDGAVADGEAEPFPLVITTAKDISRNLRTSLESYKTKGGLRRRALLATSQTLTPQRRKNLEERARERDFILVETFDQGNLADRLRHEPAWCRELLDLTFEPSALSTVPRSNRPFFDIPLIGRDNDVRWLQETSGDRLLVGVPGSGKTFLLRTLTREGWGLFLVGEDPAGIRSALVEEEPAVVIVDDAHVRLKLLTELKRLREEFGLKFDMVATTWPGSRNEVAQKVGGIPASRQRALELLTRDEIVDLYRALGITASAQGMRLLVDQAANKPGLAVTLAHMVKFGEQESILSGKIILEDVRPVFQGLTQRDPVPLLAAFALGGDRGMQVDAAAEFLELGSVEVGRQAALMAAGGILGEAGSKALSVWPRDLRPPLVREVFFQGSASDCDYRKLLDAAPNQSKVIETLVETFKKGGAVPETDLRDLLLSTQSPHAWRLYASVGSQQARWALEQYPSRTSDLPEALGPVPDLAIGKLLEEASGAKEPAHSRTHVAMQALGDWIRSGLGEVGLERRRKLTQGARDFVRDGGDRRIAAQAMRFALSPRLRWTEADPGQGTKLAIYFGLLGQEGLVEAPKLWAAIKDELAREFDGGTWPHFLSLLHEWTYPEYSSGGRPVPQERTEAMLSFARTLVDDLATLAAERPGAIAGLRRFADELGVDLEVGGDEFELLYPRERSRSLEEKQVEARRKDLEQLAQKWLRQGPANVVPALAKLESEAELADRSWQRTLADLLGEIAPESEDPQKWVELAVENNLAPDLVLPFLEQLAVTNPLVWLAKVAEILGSERYGGMAAFSILAQASMPTVLSEAALQVASQFPQRIESASMRGEIATSHLQTILRTGEEASALAAAVGLWLGDDKGSVPDELVDDWRAAVVRCRGKGVGSSFDYWLAEILAKDRELAYEWITARLTDPSEHISLLEGRPLQSAVESLSRDQRTDLLNALPPEFVEHSLGLADPLIQMAVGRDPELYEVLLNRDELSELHAVPLRGLPGGDWVPLAEIAQAKGMEASRIASFSTAGSTGWSGDGIDHWTKWDEAFEKLESGPLAKVAKEGRKIVEEKLKSAKKGKRSQEMSGVW